MNAPEFSVLFLCTHNSARSQMAEIFLRHHGRGRIATYSAGSEPSQVHPLAVQVMAESGFDIAKARSKALDEFLGQDFDYVITVCDQANESCPVFPGDPKRIHWSFPDPSAVKGSEEERLRAFRSVRDQLNMRLQTWLLAVAR